MGLLRSGTMPTYTIEHDPPDFASSLIANGTRITLTNVHISSFNGKRTDDPEEIANRVLHYLRSMCATGTVKNRHAHKGHIVATVFNIGVIPTVTLEVTNSQGKVTLGPVAGSYPLPSVNVTPSGGPVTEGVAEDSSLFCDVHDFEHVRTLTMQGETVTVHYDGTAVIAGESVRGGMLEYELKRGWTQKSQMGLHLCKDFIPLRTSSTLSRDLLGGEFFYEFKVFLNCQAFHLNADRNVVTNEETDEVSWIWQDFKTHVWPAINAKAAPYRRMKDDESTAIEAARKTAASASLKAAYDSSPDITPRRSDVDLLFVKLPRREADVSHLLAMMVQSGQWKEELAPIARFGQYIDDSTDVLVEDDQKAPLLAEIELSLPNLFRHKHPMNSYDLVIVWDLGGMSNGTVRMAPWGLNASTLAVSLLSGTHPHEWHLRWGTHSRRIIVLSAVV